MMPVPAAPAPRHRPHSRQRALACRAVACAVVSLVALAAPVQADDSFGETLGVVHFDVSGTPAAQKHAVRGVLLLHHMMYIEADREFTAALAADPACAIAHWGRAMALLHPLWPDVPGADAIKQGAAHLRAGLACPPATDRERAYLQTLAVYFREDTNDTHAARLQALDEAARAWAGRFPDDMDALAFSALFHLAPARFLPKDQSGRRQLEAAGWLEQVLQRIPEHPGALHYKIHAYDFPMLADRALEVCSGYGSIAPEVPHALHMPTHIYTRRGLWDQSIEFNRRSAEAARRLEQDTGLINGHELHALDYLAYAYLQRGQYRDAEAVLARIQDLAGPFTPEQRPQMAFAFAAIPARCALERQDWTRAAELRLRQPSHFDWSERFINCDAITHFARALGAARCGRLDSARAEIVALEKLRGQLVAARGPAYWVAEAEAQVLASQAWLQFAEGARENALGLMRRAAVIEAATDKEAVTPGEVLPAGELLGDMLVAAGRPTEALAAYEAMLAAAPNRFNSLHGAGIAAEQIGDAAKAARYFAQLLAVAPQADAGNARLDHARTYVTRAASLQRDADDAVAQSSEAPAVVGAPGT